MGSILAASWSLTGFCVLLTIFVLLSLWGSTYSNNCCCVHTPRAADEGICPEGGPVFGATDVTVSGLRFRPGARAQVRFVCADRPRAEATVDAEVVDAGTLRCKTPNFEAFGAGGVDVHVSLDGEGWTVNKLRFTYFANTAARHCLAFGPGLLPEAGGAGLPLPFIIQARDTFNERRTGGGDTFSVRVTASADGGAVEGATAGVRDMGNGLYNAHYSVPVPGTFQVRVGQQHVVRQCDAKAGLRGNRCVLCCTNQWCFSPTFAGPCPSHGAGRT